MSYAKLIHEFLDEGLSSPEEDSLFAELNRNPELRNEFNRQVKMHVITQNDMASIVPPLATTSAVFSALGFSVPVDTVAMPMPAADSGANFKSMLGKYLPVIIAIFLSIVITSFIVAMFSKNESPVYAGTSAGSGIDISIGGINNTPPDANNNIPVMSSMENKVQPKGNRQAGVYSPIAPAGEQATVTTTSPVEKWIPNLGEAETEIIALENEALTQEQHNIEVKSYNSIFSNNLPSVFDSQFFNINGGLSDITRYEILVRAANGSFYNLGGTFPQFDANLKSGSIMENISIGVFYRLSDNWIAGLEFGLEEYNQKFKFSDGNINQVRLQSSPLYWYGATLRYTPLDLMLNDGFYPFVQATAGGTKIGLLGKAQAGLSMNMFGNIGVNIGYEISAAQYFISNESPVSLNHGLTVGLVYKFKK